METYREKNWLYVYLMNNILENPIRLYKTHQNKFHISLSLKVNVQQIEADLSALSDINKY